MKRYSSIQLYSLVESHHATGDGHVARHLEGHSSHDEELLSCLAMESTIINFLVLPNLLIAQLGKLNAGLVLRYDILGLVEFRVRD